MLAAGPLLAVTPSSRIDIALARLLLVVLCRPPHVGVSVTITGGACELQVDDQAFDAVGGRIVLHSEEARAGLPRYDIVVSGGASRLAIL